MGRRNGDGTGDGRDGRSPPNSFLTVGWWCKPLLTTRARHASFNRLQSLELELSTKRSIQYVTNAVLLDTWSV